jgi:hypothetical protein
MNSPAGATATSRCPLTGAHRSTPRRPDAIIGAMGEAADLLWVSLEASPVIEAYKKDVDRTLIRENLKLTVDDRVKKMISVLRFVEEVGRASRATR